MKTTILLLACVTLCAAGVIPAAGAPAPAPNAHRVVFELTSANAAGWNGLLNNIENVRRALGEAIRVEVVAHGGGLGFLLKTNTAQSARMTDLAAHGVVFAACQNTMKRQNVTKDQLLPFATTVDSGVAELVRKQEAGWSYLHVGG